MKKFLPVFLGCALLGLSAESPDSERQAVSDELLIEQLGAQTLEERKEAEEKILEKGKVMLPLLKKASESDDPEISTRASLLIPKIHVGISQKEDHGEFLEFVDNYIAADEKGKTTLYKQLFEKTDLTIAEARAALQLHKKTDEEKDRGNSPDWEKEKFTSLLVQETARLLDKGKVRQATELWKDTGIMSRYVHKYAAMIHNAGLAPDESLFDADDLGKIKAEAALLGGNRQLAKELIQKDDIYLLRRLAAGEWDLVGRWTGLTDIAALSVNDQSLWHPIWYKARLTGDTGTMKAVIDLAKETARNPERVYESLSINPISLSANNILMGLGEVEQAFEILGHSLAHYPIYAGSSQFTSVTRSPYFDIRHLGAGEDTSKSILEYAEKEITAPEEYKYELKKQRFLALLSYMAARGESAGIIELMVLDTKKQLPRDKFPVVREHYLDFMLSHRQLNQAIQFAKQLAKEKVLEASELEIIDDNIFYSLGLNEPEMDVLCSFLPSDLPKSEKREKIWKFMGVPDYSRKEGDDVFNEMLTYLKKETDKDRTDAFAAALLKICLLNAELPRLILLLEELESPVLPDMHPESDSFRPFILYIKEFCSKRVQEMYAGALRETLSPSRTIFPGQNEPVDADKPQTGFNRLSRNVAGEYLACLIQTPEDKKSASELRRKSRLYADSENDMRLIQGYLTYPYLVTTDEALAELYPGYVAESDSCYHGSSTNFKAAYFGERFSDALLLAGRYKEACYFREATFREFSGGYNLAYFSGATILFERGVAELAHGMDLWRQGRKAEAEKYLKIALGMCRHWDPDLFFFVTANKDPELDKVIVKMYEEYRKEALKILEKWPQFRELKEDLIRISLIMNRHRAETDKLIDSMPVSEIKKEYGKMALMLDALRENDLGKAYSICRKALTETKVSSHFWWTYYASIRIRQNELAGKAG